MKKREEQVRQLGRSVGRTGSSENLLARRLHRNNSHSKLTPLNSSMSLLGSLHTSLIPSVSLRKLVRLDHSPPSLEISQGRIHFKRPDELSSLGQSQPLLKKKPLPRKFEKIDSIAEKSILPEELKESNIDAEGPPRKFKPTRKWLTKLKQGKDMFEQKLTPEDFIQLIQEEGGLGNQFCYLQKGDNPYDLRIVQFGGLTGDQYITISGRGVTYFNWEGSRFVSLEQWKREAHLFSGLMKLEFFGKYKLQKNFSNWKKYSRKNGMKKTTDKLKAELLVNDRHLRHALLLTRDLCCRMEKENYCCLEESASPLTFSKFKAAQEIYLQQHFEKRLGEIEQEIKGEVAKSLSISMRDFKQQNKISSGKQAKGLPLLIGDEKNLEMPYTKEATLRVQQEKFKRFLKLVELLVVHSKVGMMSEATVSVGRRLEEENENYIDFLGVKNGRKENFKGRQYMECQLLVEQGDERVVLRPSREQLTTLMEDIVNKSIIKLVRNHHRIIADPDINAILYEGSEQHPKDLDPTNTLKAILAAEDKQEQMVALLTRPLNISYSFLQQFVAELNPLVAQYFQNQRQLSTIPNLTAADHFTIREWIERWRKELAQMGKLNQQHDSAVFVLNFKTVKEMAIQCANLCLAKTREIVPKMLENALREMDAVLREGLKLMQTSPIGIEAFIAYQHNKTNITGRLDDYEDRLGQIGQLIQIIKDVGNVGETTILRGIKERKQLGQTLKTLRAKMEEAEMHSKVHQNYAQQEVRKMIPKVLITLQQLYSLTRQPRPSPRQMANKLQQWKQELAVAEAQLGKLKQYQKFLGMQEASEDSLKKFTSYFHTYSRVWGHRLAVQKYYNILLSQQWRNCETVAVRAVLQNFLEEAIVIKKEISLVNSQQEYQIEYVQQNELSSAIAEIKKKIYPLLEAIQSLKDSSLQERQLKFIRGQFQRRQHNQLSSLIGQRQGLVQDLSNLGIVQQLDFLKKIVFKSKKQLELNSKMASVSRFWGDSGSHSSKSLIEDFSQHYWTIAQEIDEKITILNCVRQDPEIQQGEFKTRVESEKSMFDSLKGLLGEWQKHHHFLTYFEPIFQHSFWKGTPEGKSFACAESNWRKLTKQISKDFSLRKLASQQRKHLAVLKQNNAIFADLKRSVEAFLNAKRQAFPKLYFLADEELLHFLLQDKDYASIDKHLSRIFPHLKSLELSEDHNSPAALRSSVGQILTLRPSPAKQVLQLEQGLRVIQQRMRQAVKSGLLRCSNYYLQDDFVKSQWIKQNLLQVLLFIGNAEFTKLLEYDYLQPDGEDLQQLLNYQITQIKELHVMIRQQINSGELKSHNYKLSVLLMQAAHFRDVILKLLKEGVTDDADYQWQSQIRSYYNGNDLAVTKYFGRSVEYGYEFVCPNYSFTLSTLSERQMIEMVNVAGLGYLPILKGNNDIVDMISTANARSYFSVALKSNLSSNYIHNLCQGALSSNAYLEVSGLKHLNEQSLAILSAFMFEAKAITERKQAFHLSALGKGTTACTSFNLIFRATQDQIPIIQQNLKIGYRCLAVPEVSISAYMIMITELAFGSANVELASKIEKCCQIINSCCGWRVIGLEQIRKYVIHSICPDPLQFIKKIEKSISAQLLLKIAQAQQLRFLDNLVQQIMLDVRPQQGGKIKVKGPESDSKSMLLQQILKKRQSCVLVGPGSGGRRLLVSQAARQNGLSVGLALYLDLLSSEQLLGSFENGLWKEGILTKSLRKLHYSQQQWIIFQGNFTDVSTELLQATMKGKLLQGNGEYLYLSPNWKFIFLTEVLLEEVNLQGCEAIYCEHFVSQDEQLQNALEQRVSQFFQSNLQAFSALKNYCINNYQKLGRLRLKGRFLRGQHLILCYVNALESLLAKCPSKLLEQKQSFSWIEKLAQWCIFWTVSTALSPNQIVKFESQFSESSKTDYGQSLSTSRFQFDAQGSFKKVQQHSVKLKDCPYLINEQMEATVLFAMNLIGRNKHILLVGEASCGKSSFLTYLKENLGYEYYSFLQIRLTKKMSFDNFRELLFRRAKIVVNSAKQKRLSAINGKKLVLILEDINLLEEDGQVGNFLKMILTHKYFYDSLTFQKIDLGNICVLAAQNSSYESNLSYNFIKSLKPISISAPSVREIAELYHPLLPSEYSVQLCHNIASLHQFAHIADEGEEIFYRRGIDVPFRILKMLRNYSGRQNPVKMWQYLSLKQYLQSNRVSQSFNDKITAEVKNYSNLMLKNNQQQPLPLENQEIFVKELTKRFPTISIDANYIDYYVYVSMLIQLSHSFNLFTINEPLCPSHKEEIMLSICVQNQIQYLHPYRAYDLHTKVKGQNRVVIYLSDKDEYYQEVIQEILNESKQNFVYFVDFTSEQSWKNTMKIYPSIIHYGCRYFKSPSNPQNLSLSENESTVFKAWIEVIEKIKPVDWYSQQQISRIIPRNTDKIKQKLQSILSKKQKILNNSNQIEESIIVSKKQSQNIEKQLHELIKLEQNKRKQLLQIKNSYNGQLTQALKSQRSQKIQAIQLELSDILGKRRTNQDENRIINEQLVKSQKIIKCTKKSVMKIQQEVNILTEIKNSFEKIVVFITIVEYFYTKGGSDYDLAIQEASKQLIVDFSLIFHLLFDCTLKISSKYPIIWLLNGKSIIISDEKDQLCGLIDKIHKNVQIIREVKDFEDLTTFQQDKAYIFVGEIKPQASYLNDIARLTTDKQKLKKEDIKDRQDRYIRQQKQQRPDYNKNIYFIFKEKQKEEKVVKDLNEIASTISVKSKEKEELPQRRMQRKATRMNTIRNTLSLGSTHSSKREDPRITQKDKSQSINQLNQLKQEAVIKIKYKQARQTQNFSKVEEQFLDYLTINIENEIFYNGGKKIVAVTQSKTKKILTNVSFILKRPSQRVARQYIHSFQSNNVENSDFIFEQLLEHLDPIRTSQIKNLEQQLQKMRSKLEFQYDLMLRRLEQNSQKSLSQLSKDGDFLITMTQNVQQFQQKLRQARRQRLEPYENLFTYVLTLRQFYIMMKDIAPFMKRDKGKLKKIFFSSIRYKQIGQQSQQKITVVDEVESIAQLKQAIIKGIIFSQDYMSSMFTILVLAVTLEVKQENTHKDYISAIIGIKNRSIDRKNLEDLLNKRQCSKLLSKTIQAYIHGSGNFVHLCHQYLFEKLQIQLETEYYLRKSEWQMVNQSIVFIAGQGSDPFCDLIASKNCYFIKENTDHTKCVEIMGERGINRLVLVDFSKEEVYLRTNSYLEEASKEGPVQLSLLFTSSFAYRRCNFKHRLTDHKIILLQQQKTPQRQIILTLYKTLQTQKGQYERLFRFTLFNDITNYFKQKIQSQKKGYFIQHSCFFNSEYLTLILSESKLNSRSIKKLLSQRIFVEQEELLREAKKIIKKDQEGLLKSHGQNLIEDSGSELSYFFKVDLGETITKLATATDCQDFARIVLPIQQKKKLCFDMFYSFVIASKSIEMIDNQAFQGHLQWQSLDNLTFEQFKSLESISSKRQYDPFKLLIKEYNIRYYLYYKWIQHEIKSLRGINRVVILSTKTQNILSSLNSQRPCLGLKESIPKSMQNLQKKINYFQQLFISTSWLKKMHPDHLERKPQLISIYLYSTRRGNPAKQAIYVRAVGEKEQKERGWLIGQAELMNCKYDASKNCLQVSEKNQSKKQLKVALMLGEKQTANMLTIHLPLYMREQERYRIEIPCKWKDEGHAPKQKIYGIIKLIE